jgi:hypothetical protein
MTQKTLRELVEQAASDLDRLKNPGIREARERLEEIVKALGLGTLEYDRIESIAFHGGMVEVRTTYSSRGCLQTGEYDFPEFILDEADPVKAASRWGLEKAVAERREKVAEAQRELEYAQEGLAAAEAALARFENEAA